MKAEGGEISFVLWVLVMDTASPAAGQLLLPHVVSKGSCDLCL